MTPSAQGCEDCLRIGDDWVHLRECLSCGHVGCCDSSKNKHATAHYRDTTHPIVASFQPGEDWRYCYPDTVGLIGGAADEGSPDSATTRGWAMQAAASQRSRGRETVL